MTYVKGMGFLLKDEKITTNAILGIFSFLISITLDYEWCQSLNVLS